MATRKAGARKATKAAQATKSKAATKSGKVTKPAAAGTPVEPAKLTKLTKLTNSSKSTKPSAATSATKPAKATKPPKVPTGVVARTKTAPATSRAATNALPAKAASKAPSSAKGKSIPPGPGAPKERVLFPKALYESNKDAIKAPLKANGFQWQYLGEGKGRYHRDHVAIFVEFKDEGTDYHIRFTDKSVVDALLAEWRKILGAEAFEAAREQAVIAEQAEAQQAESEAVRLWKLGEPQRRDGEPDRFLKRRRDEWLARKPS